MKAGKEGYECELHVEKKSDIAIVNLSSPITYSFLTNGNINIISNGELVNSTLEEAFSLWTNQTNDFIN